MWSPESDEATTSKLREPLPSAELTTHTARWQELRNGLAPVGDLDLLARLNLADVMAQPVLQLSQANLLHVTNVAS